MSQAILFDAEQTRRLDDLDSRPQRLDGDRLLWIDLDQGSQDEVEQVATVLDLDEVTREGLVEAQAHPAFRDRGRYLYLTTYAPRSDDGEALHAVGCVVGENWVVTAHDRPVPVLEDFAGRVSGSGDTGSLDGPGFLAALLEWVLGSYTEAFDRIEERLEDFDVQAMRGNRTESDIEALVSMRREVGHLRRALAAHRTALVALTHPELEALGDSDSSERFVSLFARFESTLEAARDAREAIVGSFDVLIARSGHQTNHIMTILTLVSVILLPGALLAGVMGMNFKVGLFDHPGLFWVVVAVIVAVAPITLVGARIRKWV
jgi:magnesium transporter